MTKVTLHYNLMRPLNDDDLKNIANVHSVYGIVRVQVAPSLEALRVDYDASRMMKTDVEATLMRYGIPIHPLAQSVA
jgi:hypothetical protein